MMLRLMDTCTMKRPRHLRRLYGKKLTESILRWNKQPRKLLLQLLRRLIKLIF
ncbi:hypothetical protein BHE74_00017706 [Ensete ventricosum]|uniref:Uncharacterized protein n=1 Tax=Ensete ventricosum TaxID=4639 RepID=A0A444F138_ENSVE|nr:hypothetical protein B296_00005615 [Ensete ventricosum]RWW16333.1 hypothetical protein GW17_00019795 [Ensete ventricosum]RWW74385.1 hypothetical protein BHE74_00017706 [Ensete ventricosum]RZR76588.1 hypothetical protein BHM03_00001433 [Ensete ventricosum]